jgi:uncharacterized protein YciI
MPDFFVYSRDAPGTAHLRADGSLLEEHWSYMDAFADAMVARGPTLREDRETPTGSLHVLSLPDSDAAREFVAQEPNNRAGVYAEHLAYRFENLLGRTMWEFRGAADDPRFLVIARGDAMRHRPEVLPGAQREWLILHGTLAGLDDAAPAGAALAVRAPDRAGARALVGKAVDHLPDVEIHDWEFGGRR